MQRLKHTWQGRGIKGQCADRKGAKIDEDAEVGKDQLIKDSEIILILVIIVLVIGSC